MRFLGEIVISIYISICLLVSYRPLAADTAIARAQTPRPGTVSPRTGSVYISKNKAVTPGYLIQALAPLSAVVDR